MRTTGETKTPWSWSCLQILKILSGKVVVGHAIHNDLKALKYSHPAGLTRDTSRIPLLNKKAGIPETDVASLKRLTKALFNRDIQVSSPRCAHILWKWKKQKWKSHCHCHTAHHSTTKLHLCVKLPSWALPSHSPMPACTAAEMLISSGN